MCWWKILELESETHIVSAPALPPRTVHSGEHIPATAESQLQVQIRTFDLWPLRHLTEVDSVLMDYDSISFIAEWTFRKSHTVRKSHMLTAHMLVVAVWCEIGVLLAPQTLFSFWMEKAAACIAVVKRASLESGPLRSGGMWPSGSWNVSGNGFHYKQARLHSMSFFRLSVLPGWVCKVLLGSLEVLHWLCTWRISPELLGTYSRGLFFS